MNRRSKFIKMNGFIVRSRFNAQTTLLKKVHPIAVSQAILLHIYMEVCTNDVKLYANHQTNADSGVPLGNEVMGNGVRNSYTPEKSCIYTL